MPYLIVSDYLKKDYIWSILCVLLRFSNYMTKSIGKLGVLTSGGDAPGMNAAIRAVVRTAIYHNIEVVGIRKGYCGLIANDFFSMEAKSVANIIQRGGTILKTARCKEFFDKEGRAIAFENIKKEGIDALIVIGGDGSFSGAHALYQDFDIPIIGIPATIDNDLYGTDFTIGFNTAVETAVEAIDKIRDTADSHDRLFIIEVMGRQSGQIAVKSGIASGAESILIPEMNFQLQDIVDLLTEKEKRKKIVNLVIVAEGAVKGGAALIAKDLQKKLPDTDIKYSILGHMQRGGSPSSFDRILASRLGYYAVNSLLSGMTDIAVGFQNFLYKTTPLIDAITIKDKIDEDLLTMEKILSI